MCNRNALQRHIAKFTNDGEEIARFLTETLQGKHPDAKYHHRLEAAKLLERYGTTGDDQSHDDQSQFWGLIPTPEELAARKEDEQSPLSPRERVRVRGADNTPSPSTGEGWDGGEDSSNQVSYADILNYDIAHLIRQETAEGHTTAEFLSHVMTRRDQPFTPKKLRIKHTDRMAAAKEILRRGHGHFGRRRKLVVDDYDDTNDYDTLHTDLAKRMREYNEHGTDAIRFLLDVMNDTSLDPEEGYTWHHKMSAAHELTRRGWDTNYDKITPEMLQAYWQDQQSTRLSIGQKKQLAGLLTFLDEYDNEDYEAIARELRDQEERESFVLSLSKDESAGNRKNNEVLPNRHSAEHVPTKAGSRNPAGQGAGTETTNPFVLSPVLSLSKDESASSPDNTKDNTSSPSHTSMSSPVNDETTFIDDLDCYYEPLTPEDQAIFNYNSLIESGEFEESEITFVPPSEAAHRDYAIALKQIKEAAESEGIPLRPNPLAGTLRRPAIRSP